MVCCCAHLYIFVEDTWIKLNCNYFLLDMHISYIVGLYFLIWKMKAQG
jgi:hypothetical protein